MKSKVLQIGFIGGGVNSAIGSTHFIASQMDGLFEVVSGVFSTDPVENNETAVKWHINPDRVYQDVDAFLSSEKNRLDAIAILTPTPQHFSQVKAALLESVPVICEKALVTNSEHAKELLDLVTATNGYLAVTYNYTGYPMLRELKAMIARGKLGEIQQVQAEMPQEGFLVKDQSGAPLQPQTWRLSDSGVPLLSLDLGVHLHNILKFLVSASPQEVVSLQHNYGNFPNIVDSVMCVAKYDRNISASLWFTKSALGYRNGLKVRIFGSEGSAEWLQSTPETLRFSDNHGRTTLIERGANDLEIANDMRYNRFKAGHPAGFLEAFANHYADIHSSLCDHMTRENRIETLYTFGASDALSGLKFIEAINESARLKQWRTV